MVDVNDASAADDPWARSPLLVVPAPVTNPISTAELWRGRCIGGSCVSIRSAWR